MTEDSKSVGDSRIVHSLEYDQYFTDNNLNETTLQRYSFLLKNIVFYAEKNNSFSALSISLKQHI